MIVAPIRGRTSELPVPRGANDTPKNVRTKTNAIGIAKNSDGASATDQAHRPWKSRLGNVAQNAKKSGGNRNPAANGHHTINAIGSGRRRVIEA